MGIARFVKSMSVYIIWKSFVSWWSPRKLGVLILAIGLAGAIEGPIPYLTIPWLGWLWKLHSDTSSELVGIGVAVLVIDAAYARREQERERLDLTLQMGSPDNGFALEAVRKLGARGWLQDGTLRKADLQGANLRGVVLQNADLKSVHLEGAILENANIFTTNLKNINLGWSNLRGSTIDDSCMCEAVLISAELSYSHLSSVDLTRADLRAVDLHGSVLPNTNLERAYSLKDSIMPDGSIYDGRYNLVGDIEMARNEGVDISDQEAMAQWYAAGRG